MSDEETKSEDVEAHMRQKLHDDETGEASEEGAETDDADVEGHQKLHSATDDPDVEGHKVEHKVEH